jgi:uncharacterized phiE125 gp8 family phage protein
MAVSLSLAKQHLRVDHDDEDALITGYVAAAVSWVENYTGKKLTRGSVTQEASCFPDYFELQWGPTPATATVDYTDTDDAPQEITDAQIVRARLYPADAWPSIADNTAVTVSYTAGYSIAPADLDHAVLLLAGEYYANRENGASVASSDMAVQSLCLPYRNLIV